MHYTRAQHLGAKFIGTLFLLATVVGSGIMADRLADGNVALALLGNTIPTGAILIVLITMFAPVSGAHFNPAVTLAFFLRRDVRAIAASQYVIVQIAGALAGVWLAHGMFDVDTLQIGTRARTGAAQWLAECVATFGLVLTILGTLRWGARTVAVAVGLYITAAYWFTASTSFANPAVTVGRALTDTFSGIQPHDVPAFVIAQFVGGILAVVIASWQFRTPDDDQQA